MRIRAKKACWLSCISSRRIAPMAGSTFQTNPIDLFKLLGDTSTPGVGSKNLNNYLKSHFIDPEILRGDAFEEFMEDRQRQLLALIEQATCKTAYKGDVQEEGEDVESDADTTEAGLTLR
ncbi:hypothetical protein PseBG33_0022 [Pseudomonas synxantha BG33R]|nr:hypothetical protein PseBG33_0022 [Pseudomonas synxantha BG33R]